MAKFLDLTGLGTFKTKIQEWADENFRKKTEKVVSTEKRSMKQSKVKNLKEIKEKLEQLDRKAQRARLER